MGRPSKLSDAQWAELLRLHASGTVAADLARRFKISPTQISKRVSQQSGNIQTIAELVSSAERAMESLPLSQQHVVRSIADRLKATGDNMSSLAEIGSATALKLARLASTHVDEMAHSGDLAGLQIVNGLTEVSNKAAAPANALIAANKSQLEQKGNITVVTGVPRG